MMYFKHYCSLSMVITNIRSRKINTSYLLITIIIIPIIIIPIIITITIITIIIIILIIMARCKFYQVTQSLPASQDSRCSLTPSPWSPSSSPPSSLQLSRLSRSFIQVFLGHHHHHHHHHRNYHDFQEYSYKFPLGHHHHH